MKILMLSAVALTLAACGQQNAQQQAAPAAATGQEAVAPAGSGKWYTALEPEYCQEFGSDPDTVKFINDSTKPVGAWNGKPLPYEVRALQASGTVLFYIKGKNECLHFSRTYLAQLMQAMAQQG